MTTPIRMKNKKMNKIHLDASGAQVISVVAAASDAASKGSNAQPANPLTPQETLGLASGPQAPSVSEEGTGGTLQAAPVAASSAGVMEAVESTVKVDQVDTTSSAPVPAGLGSVPGALPKPSVEAAKDPNAQKEATQVMPNLGTPSIVAKTPEKQTKVS